MCRGKSCTLVWMWKLKFISSTHVILFYTLKSNIFQLVCVTSMVPWMIYAMKQLVNVLARTVLQMINAANALKVSLDIQIVKVKPRTSIFFSAKPSYWRRTEISTFYTTFTNNQLQHSSDVEIFWAVIWLVKFWSYVRTRLSSRTGPRDLEGPGTFF